jgi:hypothetical protein
VLRQHTSQLVQRRSQALGRCGTATPHARVTKHLERLESGPGGLTREVDTPLPSNSPHDHMILRVGPGGLTMEVETPLPSNHVMRRREADSGAHSLGRRRRRRRRCTAGSRSQPSTSGWRAARRWRMRWCGAHPPWRWVRACGFTPSRPPREDVWGQRPAACRVWENGRRRKL